jgi:molybdopterin synthase catalytic subunit
MTLAAWSSGATPSIENVPPPAAADDWVALSEGELSVDEAARWAVLPECGALVLFAGTVRDHAEGREGVTALEYEAYLEQAEPKLRAIAASARRRWPDIGRLALLHRTGRLAVEDISVVVAVSTAHRGEAFEAGKWCIDTLKSTVPIWKRETWAGGSDWGTGASDIDQVGDPAR